MTREEIRKSVTLFSRWVKMRQRSKARGHLFPEIWEGYPEGCLNFIEWSLANGFSSELVIDRIDGTKGYSPENCRYCTYSENAFNRVYSGKYRLCR